MAKKIQEHKPIVETIINTSAIALSALGITRVQAGDYFGLCLIVFAAGLEFFKYWGRKKNYW